jgi:hypothetical protein
MFPRYYFSEELAPLQLALDKIINNLKMRAFWDTVPCSLGEYKDISEVHTASIIMVMTPSC